jgi:amino acid transporter
MAFLGAVAPEHLGEGWAALKYSSPFAQLALALNLNWLAVMLYADAFVSPSGTGITYTATTSRMIYGIQRNGTLPAILGKVDPRSGVPRPAMWFNLAVSFIFLYKFPGWDMLAEVISVATIITYLVGPVAVMVLRRTAPGLKRPLRVPGLQFIAPLAFTLATLMLYWARWPETGEIMLLLILPMPVYFYYVAQGGWSEFGRHLRGALWLVAYLVAIAFLSWIGSAQFGGMGWLPYGWDQLCVVIASLAFFWWGVRSGWRTPAVEEAEKAGHS